MKGSLRASDFAPPRLETSIFLGDFAGCSVPVFSAGKTLVIPGFSHFGEVPLAVCSAYIQDGVVTANGNVELNATNTTITEAFALGGAYPQMHSSCIERRTTISLSYWMKTTVWCRC
ncbi:MAG: hypothetical protein ACKOAU_12875 [Pirellula sp.]